MRPTIPLNPAEPSTACLPGQHLDLARALSAAFEWMMRKARARMQSAPASMPRTVLFTVIAFAPVRLHARGLRNSKGDFYFKDGR